MELGIGTVQFGLDYGVSNKGGRTREYEVCRILDLARDSGIRMLDTAAAYGESERVLGRCFSPGDSFRVVTKISPLRRGQRARGAAKMVHDEFLRSLDRLRLPRVYGLLVHHGADLLQPEGEEIWAVMAECREEGLVEKIGISGYVSKEISEVLERYSVDLVQLPLNILEQRLLKDGQISRLKATGTEVHVRSIFLQGLLLMNPVEVPSYFDPVKKQLAALRAFLMDHALTPVRGALAFVRSVSGVDVVIVGVNDSDQLRVNIEDFRAVDECCLDFSSFAINDERFVNPARWKLSS